MALETGTYIADLVATNPISSDPVGQGDDHLRLLKSTILATFPNMGNRFSRHISVAAGYTLLSTDNTAILAVDTAGGATVTHTVSLPAITSITAGWYVDVVVPGPSDIVRVTPIGGATVEGGAVYPVGQNTASRVWYNGTQWRVRELPMLDSNARMQLRGGFSTSGSVFLGSTLSVSGAAVFHGGVSVSGGFHTTTMEVSGPVGLNGTVTVSGAAQLNGTLSVAGAAVLKTTLLVEGASTFSGNATFKTQASFSASANIGGLLTVLGGQIKFPASQNASGDANTMDDYEEGTFTPTLTFATAGNVSVVYSARTGTYIKTGRIVQLDVVITTSTFTHTTSSGATNITGIPFALHGTAMGAGACLVSNYTFPASSTAPAALMSAGATTVVLQTCGSAVAAIQTLQASDHTSGNNVTIRFTMVYEADN